MAIKEKIINWKFIKRFILFILLVSFVIVFNYDKQTNKITNNFHLFMRNNGFALQDVILYGRHNTEKQNILKKTKFKYGQSIFRINLEDIKKDIEAIGWVKSVTIERFLPNRINIKITERKPIAIWQYNKKLNLIDKDGIVISNKNIHKFSYLKTVVGENANLKAIDFLKLITADKTMSQIVVAGVYISNRRWNLIILDKITVKLPYNEPKEAWQALGRYARKNNLLARPISVIDMRVPKKIFIKIHKNKKKYRD